MKPKIWKTQVYASIRERGLHVCPCWICGKRLAEKDATVDHVIPKSKGGLDSEQNYRMACAKCNVAKGSKILSRSSKPRRNWNASQRGY